MRPEDNEPQGALGALIAARCEAEPTGYNLPVSLDDAATAWFVEAGAVDVFSVEYENGMVDRPLRHIMRCESGRLVFAAAPDAALQIQLILKGTPSTRLRRVPLKLLDEAAQPDGVADDGAEPPLEGGSTPTPDIATALIRQVDFWIEDFAAAVALDIDPRPAADVQLAPGDPPVAGVLAAKRGVVWLTSQTQQLAFLGLEPSSPNGAGLMPATEAAWVEMTGASDSLAIAAMSSAELAEDIGIDGLLETALTEFQQLATKTLWVNARLLRADIANLRYASAATKRVAEHRARRGLYAVLANRRSADGSDTPLISAVRAVARHERIEVHIPRHRERDDSALSAQDILRYSDVPHRRVRLAPEERWWLGDSGAMLGFRRGDGHPLALLPTVAGRYRALDPATGKAVAVNAETAREICEDAWLLYRPVAEEPSGSGADLRRLFEVATGHLTADVIRLAVAGLAAGLLSMAPALALGVLIDTIIPSGSAGLVAQFSLALAGLALIAALAHMLRGTAVMRLEGRIVVRMTAALMNRVLQARPNSFAGSPSGELGTRVSAFERIRDRLAGAAVGALLSAIFLLPTFVVLFLYSPTLGWLMSGLGLFALAATGAIAIAQLDPYRRYVDASRHLAGDLLKYLAGIAKVRSARSESMVFASWARRYKEQKEAEIRVAWLSEHVAALSAALPVLAGAIVFAVMLGGDGAGLPLADFLVVYAVSGMFFVTVAALGNAFGMLAAFVPSCREIQPILEAEVEPPSRNLKDIQLQGGLFFDQVRFRYSNNGPDVLKDVSIRAEPGEFIGICGESGAGKSTLVKLALGLEAPASGGLYYDGQDLTYLNPAAVRRQIGLVTQDSTLQPGTILSNIIGDTQELTEEDAWRAARMAALDKDIAALPMRMGTWVSENGGGLSGGQRQRLAVAAALVRKPRIVILDEATSWLDSATQQDAMARIETTAVTRIVIAHRLSTIRNANRIYVMQDGQIVQEGTYAELAATGGVFQDLLRRQSV